MIISLIWLAKVFFHNSICNIRPSTNTFIDLILNPTESILDEINEKKDKSRKIYLVT